MSVVRLPLTRADLREDETYPYFLWWTKCTVGEVRVHLGSPDDEERAYWLGAVLPEANTRDAWLFTTPAEIRRLWPMLVRHLGRSRAMWAFLLGVAESEWPPAEASGDR